MAYHKELKDQSEEEARERLQTFDLRPTPKPSMDQSNDTLLKPWKGCSIEIIHAGEQLKMHPL